MNMPKRPIDAPSHNPEELPSELTACHNLIRELFARIAAHSHENGQSFSLKTAGHSHRKRPVVM
jgi:hypothetical protein